jgi:predicted RNA-binding Zn ribbon-like protein
MPPQLVPYYGYGGDSCGGGLGMAKIVNVFSEIMLIAGQNISESERKSQAAKRIDQFKTDLAKANMRQAVTRSLYERLRNNLQTAAKKANLPSDARNVFALAVSRLTDEDAQAIVKTQPSEARGYR